MVSAISPPQTLVNCGKAERGSDGRRDARRCPGWIERHHDVDGAYARHPCGSVGDTFLQEMDCRASRSGRGHCDANGATGDRDVVDEAEIDDVVTKLGINHDAQRVPDTVDEFGRHDGALTV